MLRRLPPSARRRGAGLLATTLTSSHHRQPAPSSLPIMLMMRNNGSRRTSASSSSSSSDKLPPPPLAAAAAATATTSTTTTSPSSLRSTMGICAELSKARLSALVVMTTSAGYLAAGGPIAWVPFASVCVGTMLAAGSANTWNQLIERENDKRMKRTFMRPLPSGRATPQFAIGWGVASAGASAAILGMGTTGLTAALGMGNLALYALPYTLSKTRSEINTWVGAVVGAVPPMMGWAAATGCNLEQLLTSPDALLLASTLFLWQFPHFFALSWVHRKDYSRGGFQMVPCQDPTGQRTASLIMRYSAYLAPLPLVATAMGVTGSMFALEGSLLNAYLLYLSQKFYRQRTDEHARAVFRCSLWYLPVLLGGFVFHNKNWATLKQSEEVENGGKVGVVEEENELRRFVAAARAKLSKVCIHEFMVHEKKVEAGNLCVPVVASQAVEEAKEVAGKVKEEVEGVAGTQQITLRVSKD